MDNSLRIKTIQTCCDAIVRHYSRGLTTENIHVLESSSTSSGDKGLVVRETEFHPLIQALKLCDQSERSDERQWDNLRSFFFFFSLHNTIHKFGVTWSFQH